MFAGAIGGLLAFDLTDFRYRLRFSASDEERRVVERRHLLRVSFLSVLGVGLASWAMWLKLQFNFDWALLLAVVAAFGIVQLVVWLRKRG
jgi:heme/copper-type cytochrome/quinol oxidase subunit 4